MGQSTGKDRSGKERGLAAPTGRVVRRSERIARRIDVSSRKLKARKTNKLGGRKTDVPQSKRRSPKRADGPQVTSVKDLLDCAELWIYKKDGEVHFLCTVLSYVDDDDNVWAGRTHVRKEDLTPEIMRETLKRKPDAKIYPKMPAHFTVFSSPVTEMLFMKRPNVRSYASTRQLVSGLHPLPQRTLAEVEVSEFLSRNPHRNIVRYHGCRVKRGRIIEIVMDRHPATLSDRCYTRPYSLNKASILKDIESAVKHLHSHGLAHNDLNPMNIMLDKHDRPLLIDFGSCRPFGRRLDERGTDGWIDHHSGTSERRHDEIALQKISAWMASGRLPDNDAEKILSETHSDSDIPARR